jgi:hypothetical protein
MQVWDMLAELGVLDLIGVNHYHSGQWEVCTEERLHWHERDPRRRAFSELRVEAARRYDRRLIVAETSHFGERRAQWLNEMASEVREAKRAGVPVEGLCLYPIVDRPDWNDEAHWHHSGLFDVSTDGTHRRTPCRRHASIAPSAKRTSVGSTLYGTSWMSVPSLSRKTARPDAVDMGRKSKK